ncbi:hypothetical protein HF086_016006 [Spodoptera exigua]|uniref:ATP synthase subunit f, mitochondrial n=1 Tax=Spodoptera exigua TaxID=7107 RepID=A0A922MMM9_SPOEX|nr:hypothetical protein HF086_016006 [Spodoptera exigua]
MGFGDYPKEYNPAVHGPYDPARYYGKPDTPFGQVKINELGSWLARRNKSPQAIAGAFSRAWWRWQHKYVQPKKVGIAPFFQLAPQELQIPLIWNLCHQPACYLCIQITM